MRRIWRTAILTGGMIEAPALAQQATMAGGALRGTAVAGPVSVLLF